MHVILSTNDKNAEFPQSGAFDLSNPLHLTTVAGMMRLDEATIQHDMEEYGKCENTEFTLLPYDSTDEDEPIEQLFAPERIENALRVLDAAHDNALIGSKAARTLHAALSLIACQQDMGPLWHALNLLRGVKIEDPYNAGAFDMAVDALEGVHQRTLHAEQLAKARAVEGHWVVGCNASGFMPDEQPTRFDGTIGEAWTMLAAWARILAGDKADQMTNPDSWKPEEVNDQELLRTQYEAFHRAEELMAMAVHPGEISANGIAFWVLERDPANDEATEAR